jgi:hypothetical protein
VPVRGSGRARSNAARAFGVAVPALVVALVLATLAVTGCRKNGGGQTDPDGGTDGEKPSRPTLAIAVTGCAELDPDAAICHGTPPLALSFAPVGTPDISRFLWRFGDGTPPVADRAPRHTYLLPRTYSVTLTGGGTFGEILADREVQVVVDPLSVGEPCDIDEHCADGLQCICGAGAGCSAAFTRGLCSAFCGRGSCGVGSTCVALALGPSAAGGDAGAPRPVCLADCASDSECSAGLVCVGARAGGNVASVLWTAACLPAGGYKRIGDPCRGPSGALDDRTCASGTCADVGALGACSASCDGDLPCPLGGACALLGDGRRLCLETCGSGDDCGLDPLLACAPMESGDATDASVGANVCSPKVCASEADCAPAGRCGTDAHCTRR